MVKSHTHEMKNHTHSGTTAGMRGYEEVSNDNYVGFGGITSSKDGGTDISNDTSARASWGNRGYYNHPADNYKGGRWLQIDLRHVHDFDTGGPSDNTTDSNDINSNENRPVNYTIKIWKRTA